MTTITKSKLKILKAVQKKNEIMHKQEIVLFWSNESFEVKYTIGFGIPIEFPSQRGKNH